MSNPQYLIRNSNIGRVKGRGRTAHIWIGGDTLCRMWSTGGMKQENYSVHDTNEQLDVCHTCALHWAKQPKAAE